MAWDGTAWRNSEWGLMNTVSAHGKKTCEEFNGREGFTKTLQFSHFRVGQGSCDAIFTDLEGLMYPISVYDLEPLITEGHSLLELSGTWVVRKRGTSYFLAMKDVEDD